MEHVRKHLGLKYGGELALRAIALLTGGDYNQGGADRVGPKQVLSLKLTVQTKSQSFVTELFITGVVSNAVNNRL
jgi:hypothetical protein